MNRYSGRETVLQAGTFVLPLVPLALVSGIYSNMEYQATFLDIGLLWLTGLGISYVLIIIHELGHVIAARMVGIEISNITIGHWRRLIYFKVGTTTVTIRAAPASGYVMPKLSEHSVSASRMIPVLLAGVAAEGIFMALIAFADRPTDITSFGDMLWAFSYISILWVGGFHAVYNLWPLEGWGGGEKMATDGLQILRLWRNRREKPATLQLLLAYKQITALCEARKFAEALPLTQMLSTQNPTNFELVRMVGMLEMECGDPDKAEMTWRELLKQPIGSSALAASVFDALCCLLLFQGRMALLGEADAWTNSAIRYAPHAITLKGTRGSVLIELGRIDEGIKMLREVAKRSECSTDQVICAAYLSKAYATKGDNAEAKRWMEKAREINAEHVVVKRLEKEQAFVANLG